MALFIQDIWSPTGSPSSGPTPFPYPSPTRNQEQETRNFAINAYLHSFAPLNAFERLKNVPERSKSARTNCVPTRCIAANLEKGRDIALRCPSIRVSTLKSAIRNRQSAIDFWRLRPESHRLSSISTGWRLLCFALGGIDVFHIWSPRRDLHPHRPALQAGASLFGHADNCLPSSYLYHLG